MKKFLSGLLVAGMLLALCATTAFAADSSNTFSDVSSTYWGSEAIERWASYDLVNGYPNGTFGPNKTMTRAEGATVFARLLGLETEDADLSYIAKYTDVKSTAWYAPYFALCVEYGIMNGTGVASMSPNATLTREMYMTMLARVLKIAGADSIDATAAGKTYSDADDVSNWAKSSVYALANLQYVHGTTGGSTGTLDAKDNITRAQVMALLNQTIYTYSNTANESVTMGTFSDTGNGVTLIVADGVTTTGDASMLVVAGKAGSTVTASGTASIVTVISDDSQVNFTVTEDDAQIDTTDIYGVSSSVNFIVLSGNSLTLTSTGDYTEDGSASVTVRGQYQRRRGGYR